MNPDNYLMIEEAAKLLGFNVGTVSRLCRQGKIEGAFRFGGRWLIPKESAKNYKPGPQGFAAVWQRRRQAQEQQELQESELELEIDLSDDNAVEAEKERLCKELAHLEEKNLEILHKIEIIRKKLLRLKHN